MNSVEKLRIMLQHWVEHNKGHMDEFAKWGGVVRKEGQEKVADHLEKTVALMKTVNDELQQALVLLGAGEHRDKDDHHHHGHGHHGHHGHHHS